MIKKVGIATFHWADDYGALLQTYGLKYALRNAGYEAEVIPYAPFKCVGRYWPIQYLPNTGKSNLDIKTLISCIKRGSKYNLKHFLVYFGRHKAMKLFRRTYLTKACPLRRACNVELAKYDIVFVGSDQVWNPVLTIGFDDLYSGKIKKDSQCKFVSYAASLGENCQAIQYENDFKSLLSNFAMVSVRERSALSYVEKLYGGKVQNVIDPTLLNDASIWEKMMKHPKENGYILIYHTSYVEKMEKYVKDLALLTGKKVIRIGSSMRQYGNEYSEFDFRPTAGPCDFLGYIYDADCVVTNSFHGTVFSVLFEKQFVSFGYEGRSARIIDLLEYLCLGNKFFDGNTDILEDSIREIIDWDCVRKKIDILRKESIQYIEECLQK